MTLYLDASALVKRYINEDGSDAVREAMERASGLSMCRIGFVETIRAVALGGDGGDVRRAKGEWASLDVIEVDHGLSERAAELALSHGLRALDALHLAAAMSLPRDEVTFASWDARLHAAARDCGLETLPTALA